MENRAYSVETGGTEMRVRQAGVAIMAVVAFALALLYILTSDVAATFPYFFIIPWLLALLVVLLIPSAILWYRGKWKLENPIVFAALSYFIPAFVVGGFALAAGISQPYYLEYIQDADTNLPYTIQLIMLGFIGLSVGYFLPFGRIAGSIAAKGFSGPVYTDPSYVAPGLVLLGIGIINSGLSLVSGLFGFQHGTEVGTYDGLIFLSTLFWLEASFMLWFLIFRRKRSDTYALVIIALLTISALVRALFAGNRSSLLQVFICVILAYLMSGREFKAKQFVWSGTFLVTVLIAGTIYGTIFRDVKGSEEQQSVGSYAENILATIDKIGTNDNSSLLGTGFTTLAERLDTLSSVAVVVSSYEQLAPYEASYDLENNIQRDLVTFVVPRVVWPEKPLASEPRKYSQLYFNYGDNSFAITPIGDLLRNFGVPGVFIGMLVLGILLRFIYRWLVEDQPRVLWRSTLYFMLLTAVSYEGFYGAIIPFVVKVGITGAVGLILVNFLAKRTGGRLAQAA